MKYNIIALDPSLNSTALIVSSGGDFKIFNYCRESKVFGKKGMTKWFKFAEQYVTYRYVSYREFENYSEGELTKLKDYDLITDNIIKDIIENIDVELPTKVGIEGYNFGAQAGGSELVDLVTFSTLLRKKLYDKISKDIMVVSPKTLKLESCKLTYEPIAKEIGGKNKRIEYIWKNGFGIPGGSFTKLDMYMSIVDNKNLDDYWSNHCKSVSNEMSILSNIPKPYEDINDAIILYYYLKNKKKE